MTHNQYVVFARSLVAVVRDQQLSFLAAAIAYYAFVSTIPLVLVTLAVATAVAGRAFARQVVGLVGELLTPTGASLVETALTSGAGRGGATVIGLGVLLWSSLRLFRGLDIAFAQVYGGAGTPSLLSQIRDALVVFAGIAAGLGATVALGAVIPLVGTPFASAFGSLFLTFTLSVVFLPMYYVFPDHSVTVREALPGAVVAAGGWTVLSTVFGFYARQAPAFQLYGVIGGVLLVLTWFYFGALLLLLGAALNATFAARGDRQLQQGALRDDTQRMSDPDGPPDEDAAESEDYADDETEGVATVEPESVDYEDFAALRRELEEFEEEIEHRTVHREELEADLKRYVRRRVRRGHARGWGPYLVLLYGTAMTIGAFYFLAGVWAVLAMLVIWLSTLGLYTLMLIVGTATTALGVPGRILDRLREFRP